MTFLQCPKCKKKYSIEHKNGGRNLMCCEVPVVQVFDIGDNSMTNEGFYKKMMKMKSRVNPLVLRKHELIRQFDRKEIDEKTFNERFAEVRKQINENVDKVLGEKK